MYIKKGKPYFQKKDTWSMDMTLAPIIAAGLVKFKEAWVAHPFAGLNVGFTCWCIDSGMVTPKDDDYNWSEGDWAKMEQVYVYMLDEMIYAFGSKEPDTLEEMKAYQERCDQGRMWFAEYFHSLWT